MKRIALAAALLVSLAAPVWAGFYEGWAAYQRGDVETAFWEWKPLAEQGHAEAQFNIGLMYDKGQGMPQDYAEAAKWYRRAAEQGVAAAQASLGDMYFLGLGVPQAFAEAAKWYRRAAEQGFDTAHASLGSMYRDGMGVPLDSAEAAKGYRMGAAEGDAAAQYNIGVMYARGQGVPQDYVLAHMWLDLAAARSSPGEARDRAIKGRDLAAKYMTLAQIAEAERLAREWKPKSE